MTSTSVARAVARGPSPTPTSDATTAPSTAHTSAVSSSARTDRPGPLHHLDDGFGALLHDAALDVAQPGLARAGDVALVAGDQLFGDPGAGSVADQQVDQDVGRRLGAALAPRQRRDAGVQVLGLADTDVFDGPLDEVVEGREVVRRRGQRQPGAAGDGAMSDGVEATFAQQLGGRADQRVPSPLTLGGDRCRHVLHAASNGPTVWGFRQTARVAQKARAMRTPVSDPPATSVPRVLARVALWEPPWCSPASAI